MQRGLFDLENVGYVDPDPVAWYNIHGYYLGTVYLSVCMYVGT